MTTRIVLCVALLTACSGKKSEEVKKDAPASSAEPVSAEDRALAGKWVALYGEYAAALEGADCARAVTAIGEVNGKNADLIATGKSRMRALRSDPAKAKWYGDNIKPKLGAALDRMAPVLDSCRGNAGVSAALAAGAFDKKP